MCASRPPTIIVVERLRKTGRFKQPAISGPVFWRTNHLRRPLGNPAAREHVIERAASQEISKWQAHHPEHKPNDETFHAVCRQHFLGTPVWEIMHEMSHH